MKPLVLSAASLDALVESASKSPRRRQHHNIHSSYEDPAQRVLNAIGVDSYIRPHRHRLDPKPETMVAMRGMFALICFDDAGIPLSITRFGSEKFASGDVAAGVQVPPDVWHSVLALVPGSVILEVKPGPFLPDAAKEFASWAPEEASPLASHYAGALRELVTRQSVV